MSAIEYLILGLILEAAMAAEGDLPAAGCGLCHVNDLAYQIATQRRAPYGWRPQNRIEFCYPYRGWGADR